MNKIKLSPYHTLFYNEWRLKNDRYDYNIVFDQELDHNLDIERLKQSLKALVDNSLIINSHVVREGEELFWVRNNTVRQLEFFENEQSKQFCLSYVLNPFDLENEPLYRFGLFLKDTGSYRLLLVFHHILIDGNKFNQLINQISIYYNSNGNCHLQNNEKERFNQLNLVIKSDYDYLEQYGNEHKKFWLNKLQGFDPVDLRFARNSDHVQKRQDVFNYTHVESIYFNIPLPYINKCLFLAQKYSLSIYNLSKIIFLILIHKYTSQTNFAICYPIQIKEYSNLDFGAGVNTVSFPCIINGQTCLNDLLELLRIFIKEINKTYSRYPIANILASLNKDISEVFFASSNFKNQKLAFNGVNVLRINNEFESDLSSSFLLEHEFTGSELNFRIRYKVEKFEKAIIEQFANHYKKIFFRIIDDLTNELIHKTIDEYAIVDLAEYQKIVSNLNNQQQYPFDSTIHQEFEHQVIRTPNKIAIISENIKITYQELNQRANQLACYIRDSCNLDRGGLIALCLERNELMLISILAVLKTGNAYIPIDINNYPSERIKYILLNTEARLVLVNKKNSAKIKNIEYSQPDNFYFVVAVEDAISCDKYQDYYNNLAIDTKSNELAYVVYTSGTTGRPKGVMVEHKSVLNYVSFLIRDNNLSSNSIGSQYSSIGFDALVIEIFPILLSGGTLLIIKEDQKLNPQYLNEIFYSYQVTYAFLPPQIAEIFFNYDNPYLETLIVGGDKLRKSARKNYRLINAYGPTEATVQSNQFEVKESLTNIPIGKPIANVTNYVLDINLKPVPIGVIGELYIGGAGVTRGYLNNDELTRQKFIKNPLPKSFQSLCPKDERIFKTGDLVRYLPTGDLEYIGRNDFQIKIRGYRIELGEIESLLSTYPGIKQVFVTILENTSMTIDGDKSEKSDLNSCLKVDCNSDISNLEQGQLRTEQGILNGRMGLLPIQDWFFQQNFVDINHWNQSFLIKTPPLDPVILKQSIYKLIEYHDSLRIYFHYNQKSKRYEQYYSNKLPKEINLHQFDIREIPYREDSTDYNYYLQEILTRWQSSFNISTGNTYCIGYLYGFSDGSCRIFFAFHHLIMDGVSWRIILHDLEEVYTQLEINRSHKNDHEYYAKLLATKGTSYRQWIDILNNYSRENSHQKLYWEPIFEKCKVFNQRLLSMVKTEVKSNYSFNINNSYTSKLISKVNLAFENKINDIFLSAIIEPIQSLFAEEDLTKVYLTLEGHGREDVSPLVDISRTVGWFTSMFPVQLEVESDQRLQLQSVKKTLESTPLNGVGFGAFYGYSHLPLISFNYLGQLNQNQSKEYWMLTGEPGGENISKLNPLHNIVNINCYIANGELNVNIESKLDISKSEKFVEIFKDKLLDYIDIASQKLVSDIDSAENVLSRSTRLVAYYASDSCLDVEILRNFLLQYLPTYSVPQQFVFMHDIPLNANGKVDKNALPDPNSFVDNLQSLPETENEKLIFKDFTKILGRQNISIDDDFFKVGGDSILAINLVIQLQNNFQVAVRDIFNYRTIRGLAKNLRRSIGSIKLSLLNIRNFYKEKVYTENSDSTIVENNLTKYLCSSNQLPIDVSLKAIKTVMVTGATGFLGCNILNQLLHQTEYKLYLLVRAETDEEALNRLNQKTMSYFSFNLSKFKNRVRVFAGNLEEAELGLDSVSLSRLFDDVDSIIHCAALVKQLGNYDVFYRANVTTTINLLDICLKTGLKDFHYISTASLLKPNISSNIQWGNNLSEELLPNDLDTSNENLYLRTKLEAETQVLEYRKYGVNSNIYRVGNLAFISQLGLVQDNKETVSFVNWIKYFVKSKRVYENCLVEISPVDLTADAIIKLFDKRYSTNKIFHVFNPYKFDLSHYLSSDPAVSAAVDSIDYFITNLLDGLEMGLLQEMLYRFLLHQGWLGGEGVFQFSNRNYLQDKTHNILNLLGFEWQRISSQQFKNYLGYIMN